MNKFSFLYEKSLNNDHAFPVIDFSFINKNKWPSVFWKFIVHVIETEIDQTPEFEISAKSQLELGEVQDETLIRPLLLYCRNVGWGPATQLKMRLDNQIFDKLYNEEERSFTGNILNCENHAIMTLAPKSLSRIEFETLCDEILFGNKKILSDPDTGCISDFMTKFLEEEWVFGKKNSAMPMNQPQISWSCLDSAGQSHQGKTKLSIDGGMRLILTNNGIKIASSKLTASLHLPSIIYCSIIDPDIGPNDREYSIYKKIPPMDTERFHIMIGATKSCRLRLFFEFCLEEEKRISSNKFDIKINRSRTFPSKGRYRDGDEILKFPADWYLNPTRPDSFPFLPKNDRESDGIL